MKPIKTEHSNFTYTAPEAAPEVGDLPCELAVENLGGEQNHLSTYSVWELTEVERRHVAQGGNVKLGIVGAAPIPPVSLQIVDERSVDGAVQAVPPQR